MKSTSFRVLLLAASLAAVTAAPAQSPHFSFTAETNLSVFAKIPTQTALVAKRAGQSAYPGLHAIITGNSTISRLYLQTPTLQGVEASLYWYGRAFNTRGGPSTMAGTSQSTDWRNPTPRLHAVLVTLTGHATGNLTIYYGGSVQGTGGHSRIQVDMDADGSFEYRWSLPTASKQITIPYSVSGTRQIRVIGDCLAYTSAPGPSSYTYSNSVRFVFTPQDGQLTSYGSGCGPALTGTLRRTILSHSLNLLCRGAFPSQPVLFTIGHGATSFPFPGTSCNVLTMPRLVVPATATSTGYANLHARTSGFFTGSMNFQAAPLDPRNGQVRTSNGLRLEFR